jgi:hypothetical protein
MRRAKSMGLGISAFASISGASPLALVTTTGRELNLGSARCRSRNSQPLIMGIIRSRMIRDVLGAYHRVSFLRQEFREHFAALCIILDDKNY